MRVARAIQEHTVSAGSVAIWWLGQNSYVVQSQSVCIMVDPFFSRPGSPERYIHREAPLRADDLCPDAVFCTHNHSDHTDPEFLAGLARKSSRTRFYGPPESAEEMRSAGVPADRLRAVTPGDEVITGEASVTVVLSKTSAASDVAHYGYVIDVGGPRVYNSGDIMRGATGEPTIVGPIREAAPHVALITTSPVEEEFPDFEEGAALAVAIGAQVAIPAHYDCFAKRTFDPAPFAARLSDSRDTLAEIIPYCGCYEYTP